MLTQTQTSPQTLADTLAKTLIARIRTGVYRPGDRLPSVRALARSEGVNPQTAVRALQALEDEGLAEPRPRSGWFVRPPRQGLRLTEGASPPQPVAVPALARRILTERMAPGLIPMAASLPGPDLLPLATLARLHASALRTQGAELLGRYGDPAGDPALRRAVARLLEERGVWVPPDGVIITNGCMEALDLALGALTVPGDVVAVESPAYYGVLLALAGRGVRVVELAADSRSGVSRAAVRAALETGRVAAFLLSPVVHNPLGGAVPVHERQAIRADLAAAGVPLIEDDCFGFLAAAREDARPMMAFDPDGSGVLCGSVSKTVGPGMRLGWIVPGRHHEAVVQAVFRRHLAHPAPAQAAVAAFLDSGGHARLARRAVTVYRRRLECLQEELHRQLGDQVQMAPPRAGMNLWLTLPEGVDGLTVHAAARDRGVALAPGMLFSASGGFGNALRLSIGAVDEPQIAEAVRRLAPLLRPG